MGSNMDRNSTRWVTGKMASVGRTLPFLFILFLAPTTFLLGQASDSEESGEDIIGRELFMHMRRAGGPGRSIPENVYANAVVERQHLDAVTAGLRSVMEVAAWQSVNPSGMFYARTNNNYIAGRTNSIAFHPANADIMYLGAAGGGVWKTTNAGTNWQPMTENLTSLASGAVAIDPNDPEVIYYGTGEQNYSGDSYYGDGVYKSSNGGTSWTKIATTSVGSKISQVVVNPSNSTIVYLSGTSGVYKSMNAGSTWASTSSGSNANCLLVDPSNPEVLYTTTGGSGTNVIKKTTNGGTNWTTLSNGLPASGTGRTQLAMAASNTAVLYASIARNASPYDLVGLYRTTDAGASWTLQSSSTNYLGSQGWYDNAVTVHPTNSDIVVTGGLDIYVSTNGGSTLTQKTVWSTTSSSNMSHADIHFLGYSGSVLYCGSDGGVYKSTNDGTSWSDLNQTISTLQYQSADFDPFSAQKLYGGTQDNNLETSTNNGTVWIQRTTGDGGYSIVDSGNTNFVYGQYVNGSLKRSTNAGVSFTEIKPTGSSGGLFYNPYEMAPGEPNTIVFGRADVWKTTSARTSTSSAGWTQIATAVTVGGNVSSIAISTTNANKIYIGTSNGRILVTTNNGSSWATSTGFPYVSDLAVDPTNDNICYASFTGFSATTHVHKTTNGGGTWSSIVGNLPNIPVNTLVVLATLPRTIFVGTDLGVYQSTDDGGSWSSFNNSLPTVAVFDLKYREPAKFLIAATHGRGCFVYDLNSSLPIELARFTAVAISPTAVRLDWMTLSETNNYGFEVQKSPSLPNQCATVPNSFVPGHGTTVEPQYYTNTDITAGEGSWYYRLKQIDLDGTIHYSDGVQVDVLTGVSEEQRPVTFSLSQNHPNPFNPSTTIEFTLPHEAHAKLEVFNTLGQRRAIVVDATMQPGNHTVTVDAANWASGVYYYRLSVVPTARRDLVPKDGQADGFVATRKFILAR